MNAYTRTYSYDKMGNILQLQQLGSNAFTRNFNYNTDANTLADVKTGSNVLIEDFTYDLCGNQLTAGTTRHYQWTAANRLLIYKNQTGSSDSRRPHYHSVFKSPDQIDQGSSYILLKLCFEVKPAEQPAYRNNRANCRNQHQH